MISYTSSHMAACSAAVGVTRSRISAVFCGVPADGTGSQRGRASASTVFRVPTDSTGGEGGRVSASPEDEGMTNNVAAYSLISITAGRFIAAVKKAIVEAERTDVDGVALDAALYAALWKDAAVRSIAAMICLVSGITVNANAAIASTSGSPVLGRVTWTGSAPGSW